MSKTQETCLQLDEIPEHLRAVYVLVCSFEIRHLPEAIRTYVYFYMGDMLQSVV